MAIKINEMVCPHFLSWICAGEIIFTANKHKLNKLHGTWTLFQAYMHHKRNVSLMKSKHMSSVTVAAAGNDIRGSLADFRGLLTFPRLGLLVIYDLVRSLFSAMFHCKNNKTARQNKPTHTKRELERLLLTTSARGSTASTADPSGPHIGVCGHELLWWLQIYGDVLLIAPIGADRAKGGEWGLSHSLAQFIPQQDLDMLLYVQNGRDQTSRAMNLWTITE